MWLKISDDSCVPETDVVGFFRPGAVAGERGGGGEKAKSVVLLKDGRQVFSASGPKTLQNRINRTFLLEKRKVPKENQFK